MCGIAGIVGDHIGLEELQAMCATITHRGPDEEGFYLGAGAGLGIRRLRVIDLETGGQPMKSEDEAVAVVMNGEIYNYRELRRELEGRGYRFRSHSDTETLVHLYEEYGIGCVRRLRGMFGFAIWDARDRTLHLARDRLGIKPLYYGEAAGRFVFASELKAILELPFVERELNWQSVNHLFAALTTPATESIIRGIHKLEPACTLTLVPGKPARIERYWHPTFEPDRRHGKAWFIEGLRALLEESVRLHSLSDVPLGAFLSGGLDSSSVVALMARQSSRPVKTFSIGFGEHSYDEGRYARQIAERFDTDHHEVVLEPDIEDLIEEVAWHLDEPFGDSSAIPTWVVSKLAAQDVTVVLSGDGGDELFAGYDKYAVEARERRRDRLPAALRGVAGGIGTLLPEGAKGRNFLRHLALTGNARYLDDAGLFKPEQRRRLFGPRALAEINDADPWREAARLLDDGPEHWLSRLQHLDLNRYLPLDILTKVDRMSMAHSIEARVPLLDHRLVEFAATIPPELQRSAGESKHLFKAAMRGILPEDIITRRKHGFAVPLGAWFRGRLTPFVRDLLLSETARKRGIINPRYVERLLAMHEGGRNLDLHLWTLMSFELWCRRFLDTVPEASRGLPPSLHQSPPPRPDSRAAIGLPS